MRLTPALATASIAVAIAPSGAAQSVVVASRTAAGTTELHELDLTMPQPVRIADFAGSGAPPLALAWDPIDGRVVLAVDVGAGVSRLLRVGRATAAPNFVRPLVDVPGEVTGIGIAYDGRIAMTVGGAQGGVWRCERDGSDLTLALALPYADALCMSDFAMFAIAAAVSPSGLLTLVALHADTGVVVFGPFSVAFPAGRQVTGVADLPTGAFRQVVTDDAGDLHVLTGGTGFSVLPLTPPPSAGSMRAMHTDGGSLDVFTLGDATDPFLRRATTFGSQAGVYATLAGPLPGDPVDFAVTEDLIGTVRSFGIGCGLPPPTAFLSGAAPALGATLSFDLAFAPPSAPATILFGLDDQQWAGLPLPLRVPISGCDLYVEAAIAIAGATDSAGNASLALTIPGDPGIVGSTWYTQWLTGPALVTTQALVFRVGP